MALRVFYIHFAGDCRRRIRRAGNDVSAQLAGLYSRSNFNLGQRRGIDGLRFIELSGESFDISNLAAIFNGNFRRFVGYRRRGLVYAKPKFKIEG